MVPFYTCHDCGFKILNTRVMERYPQIVLRAIVGRSPQVLSCGDKRLSYYCSIEGNDSFSIISKYHVQTLRKLGWGDAEAGEDWVIIHPVFYLYQEKRLSLNLLRKFYSHLGGFDLADTDRISSLAVRLADDMDLIMVPSECSKRAYLGSGVKSRVEVVPHGVDEKLYSSPKKPSPLVPKNGVKILFFCLHSELRKGADVVRRVMGRVLKERSDVTFIVKGGDFKGFPRTRHITKWLSEQDLVRLYDSCDIGLTPSRGGGFELNVLEMLARGLIVITSDWPAIQEYAKKYVLTIKSTGRKFKPLSGNPIHCGYGADPDVNHCYQLIKYALDNLEGLKKRAEKNAPRLRKKYSWRKTGEKIVKCL